MKIKSWAPCRIDFAGGMTDVALFTEDEAGIVVNATIDIYSHSDITFNKDGLKIYSEDFDTLLEVEDIKQLKYDGNLDLIKSAIVRFNKFFIIPTTNLKLKTKSEAPPGSGLGTSAAMGVSLMSILSSLAGVCHIHPAFLAELASDIEQRELNIRGGKQDHYASAAGGFNYMKFKGENVEYQKLNLSKSTIRELEKDLVLCYSGQSRLSGDVHEKVANSFIDREQSTLDALNILRSTAKDIKDVLLDNRLEEFGWLLNQNWNGQKLLHPEMTNDWIDNLFKVAYSSGAIGGKVLGAGGGGCIIFYCPNRKEKVSEMLAGYGAKVMSFRFVTEGVNCVDG